MALLIIGINHRTAGVERRERVSFPETSQREALSSAWALPRVSEIGLLSTCNRTELYVAHEGVTPEDLIEWWGAWVDVDTEDFADSLYMLREQEAVRHLMRVASGLDSMVLGEPQVLGQLKDAYHQARDAGTTGPVLSRLFEHSFSVAKRVRTDTAIGENPVSVAYAAVSMARHIFADMAENRALLIGAGQTVELVAQHLYEAGIRDIVVANRSLERAETVAERFDGRATSLASIPDELPRADIVITSTGSQLPILGKGAVEKAIRKRKHRPVFMVDIAVPRDIESEVGDLDDVFLYTVDDLRDVIEENRRSREGAAEEAEHLIQSGASDFMYQLRALDAVAVLKQFRGEAEAMRDTEVEKALKALASGADPETLLRSMARSLTNKFLHHPTVQVRRATAEGRVEVTDWLRELHGVTGPADSASQAGPGPAAEAAPGARADHSNT